MKTLKWFYEWDNWGLCLYRYEDRNPIFSVARAGKRWALGIGRRDWIWGGR